MTSKVQDVLGSAVTLRVKQDTSLINSWTPEACIRYLIDCARYDRVDRNLYRRIQNYSFPRDLIKSTIFVDITLVSVQVMNSMSVGNLVPTYRLATFIELLALGLQYPNIQREGPIIAPSLVVVGGKHRKEWPAVCLSGSSLSRELRDYGLNSGSVAWPLYAACRYALAKVK